MREDIQFWKNWIKEDRFPFWVGLQFVIIGIFCTCFFKWQDISQLIPWQTVSALEKAQFSNESFSFFFFDIPIPTTTYVIESYFAAGYFQIHEMVFWLYGILLMAGVVFLLASITELRMIGYLGGVTIFSLFITFLNLDHHQILGNIHPMWFTLLVLLVNLPLTYIFRSIYKTNTTVRILVFLSIQIAFVLTVSEFSALELPVKALLVNSTILPLIAFVVSCVFLAPEIIRGIVFILTDGKKGDGSGSLLHFCIISSIYFLNLFYLFYQYFTLGSLPYFVHIPAILIYIGSVVIGLWGWKKRETHYERYFPFHTTGAYLYLSVIVLSLAFLCISYGTGNNSYIELSNKVIFIVYIGFGLATFGYILSNFNALFKKELDVHKVFYLPTRLDYSMAMLIGMALTLVFGARGYTHTYHQSFAGYYNNKAYLASLQGDLMMAERYYNTSMAYDPKNHFGAYGLSSLGIDHEHYGTATLLLEDALYRTPTPQAYANMGILKWTSNQKFKALFQLEDGLKRFEDNSELSTNYAYYAKRMNLLDTTLTYLNDALEKSENTSVPLANIYAYAATTPNLKTQLPAEESEKIDFMVKGNQYAALLKQQIKTTDMLDTLAFEGTDLDSFELFYVVNYLLNKKEEVTTAELKFVERLELANLGTDEFVYLLNARATVLYAKGDIKNAMPHFQHLSETSAITDDRYDFNFGLRLMEQKHFAKAVKYFQAALAKGHPDALYYLGLASSEAGNIELAKQTWKQIATVYPENTPIQLLNKLYDEVLPLQGEDEYLSFYLHYHHATISDQAFEKLCLQFQNTTMLTYGWLDRADYFLQKGEVIKAENILKDLMLIEEYAPYHRALQLELSIKKGIFTEEETHYLEVAKIYWGKRDLTQRYLAGYYTQIGERILAKEAYENALLNSPYDESLYLNYAKLLLMEEATSKAYEVLLLGVELLDTDELQKEYALVSLKMGYDGFAEHTKTILSERLNAQAFAAFMDDYNQIAL